MKLDLKELIAKLTNTPMVIEQGTSGIWTYRKWSNGTSECWGKASATSSFAVWANPIYYATTYIARQNFPTGLFTSIPSLNVSLISSSGSDGWIADDSTSTTNSTSTGRFYMLRVSSVSGTPTYTVSLYAIGKWK